MSIVTKNTLSGVFLRIELFADHRYWETEFRHCFTLFIINKYETSNWYYVKKMPDVDNLIRAGITLMTWWKISWSTLLGLKWTDVSQDLMKSRSREIWVKTSSIALTIDRRIGQRCRNSCQFTAIRTLEHTISRLRNFARLRLIMAI